jgi:putative FmdB family regulatory protein
VPIYEYECNDCGHAFEFLVRGEEKAVCPACGRAHLTRAMSAPAAHTGVTRDPSCPSHGMCNSPHCGGGGCGLGM